MDVKLKDGRDMFCFIGGVYMSGWQRFFRKRPTPPPFQKADTMLSAERQQFINAAVWAGGEFF